MKHHASLPSDCLIQQVLHIAPSSCNVKAGFLQTIRSHAVEHQIIKSQISYQLGLLATTLLSVFQSEKWRETCVTPQVATPPFPLLIRRILRLGSALSSEMLLLAPLLLALLPAVPAFQAGISPPQTHPHSNMHETISKFSRFFNRQHLRLDFSHLGPFIYFI
ncbi:hypothetical protein CDAR_449631 [Caerostris darwini]|uniref:Uncharacterized protein n=1 Tax=Caerostris darwini TaxID=1538125 RepID=A0AAV4QUS7_9ARAC|nr:hypothetical protein CDAR_449631 [Caerostris darwini]